MKPFRVPRLQSKYVANAQVTKPKESLEEKKEQLRKAIGALRKDNSALAMVR